MAGLRKVKQGYDIVNDVWDAVKNSVSVTPVYKYNAPLTAGGLPQNEYIVVSLLSADAEQAYNALVNVNIHVPNIGVYPNEIRFVAIASVLIDNLDLYNGQDFQLTTDVAGRLNRSPDGTHFYSLRFFYSTAITQK